MALRSGQNFRNPGGQNFRNSHRVSPQLGRDRRRVPPDPQSDVANPDAPGVQERDLFAFGERQVAPRLRLQIGRRHPAILAKPPRANWRRHARSHRSLFARRSTRDRLSERLSVFTASCGPTPRRSYRGTSRTIRLSPLFCSSHCSSSMSRSCDDRLNSPRTRARTTKTCSPRTASSAA